jgi:hypothetical protein
MNPKITRILGEIEKTKEKIAERQSRLRELERMKTELENADIVAMVRGIDIPPSEFEAFARAFMEQRKTTAVPDSFALPPGRHRRGAGEDIIKEETDTKEVSALESNE